jgi:hypothetical protein
VVVTLQDSSKKRKMSNCRGCDMSNQFLVDQAIKKINKVKDHVGLIADGWINVVKRAPETELVAAAREKICKKCEHQKKVGVTIGSKQVKVDYCGLCNCPIMSKTRSMGSECPDGRWRKHLKTI